MSKPFAKLRPSKHAHGSPFVPEKGVQILTVRTLDVTVQRDGQVLDLYLPVELSGGRRLEVKIPVRVHLAPEAFRTPSIFAPTTSAPTTPAN